MFSIFASSPDGTVGTTDAGDRMPTVVVADAVPQRIENVVVADMLTLSVPVAANPVGNVSPVQPCAPTLDHDKLNTSPGTTLVCDETSVATVAVVLARGSALATQLLGSVSERPVVSHRLHV